MRTLAAAKINWTLEALGKRDDGYHEVRSVMQTIELDDVVSVEPARALALEVSGPHAAGEDDLALLAARALAEATGRDAGVAIHLVKQIPVAAGLGGGSSDAAAVLRCLDRLWGAGLSEGELAAVAARVSSDAPFFVHGGTALVEGRGERITPLPDAHPVWLVLLAPRMALPDKTRRMYASLTSADFTDGARTAALAERVRAGGAIADGDLYNAFERAAYEAFNGLAGHRRALLDAGAGAVHLAGSGPALFCLARTEGEARDVLSRLWAPACRTFACRTLTAAESVAVAP